MKRFCFLFSFFFFLFCLNSAFSQSKGGRWQFENNGFDTADWDNSDNTGTLVENAAYVNAPPLQEGQYYLFLDTLFQYACFRVPDGNDLDFTDENIGISAWIYPLELRNDVYFLVNKGRQDSNPKTTNYAMRISLTQRLEFLIRDANNQAQPIASRFTIPVNQWTFVAIFYDYAMGKVYMWNAPGDTPADTLTYTRSFFANNDPLTIGGWYQNNATMPTIKPFKGRMDDVRISGRMEDILPVITSLPPASVKGEDFITRVLQIFPNPVNQSEQLVNFKIQVPANSGRESFLRIYNILGQQIYETRFNPVFNAVPVSWNLLDNLGRQVNTGMYFIQVQGQNYQEVRRLLIVN